MTREHDPCAMCERFTVAGRADLPPGHGWRSAWEQPKPWNGQIGVLFIEAKNRTARQRYVAQQQEQQQELEKA
jgi:hypothetical protein